MVQLLVRLVLSMAAVMAVMWLAAKFVRHRQGSFGGGGGAPGRRPVASGSARLGTTGRRSPGPSGAPGPRGRRPRMAPPVEIVYRRPLAKGAWIAVVESPGRQYMLGVTEHSVNLLGELAPEGTGAGAGTGAQPNAGPVWLESRSLNRADLEDNPFGSADFPPEAGRMPASPEGTSLPDDRPDNAWKLVLESLRERTVRR